MRILGQMYLYSWSSLHGQRVMPVKLYFRTVICSCTGTTFCPYRLDQLFALGTMSSSSILCPNRSLKSLNCSWLLSEPWFWERLRSIRKRAKSDKRTDKIQILSGSLMNDIGEKERSKNGCKNIKMHRKQTEKLSLRTEKLSFWPKS